ncbi:hypothetical protein F5887DRAFT_1076433 [Amanita rubescens]|nr:hypothetical protein F5887DRAFT_1076433 [Amanita rubescens]
MPGRKSKKQKQYRNLSGLRNQPKASPTGSSYNPTPSPGGDGYESDLELLIHFDSMKVTLKHEGEHTDPGDDGDEALEVEWSRFHSPDLADAMGAMIHDDDGPNDLDWVPSRMRKELVRREKKDPRSTRRC